MAKYDTYTLSIQLGDEKNRANLSLTVLFEAGDVESEVIEAARLVLEAEAVKMRETEFLDTVEQ